VLFRQSLVLSESYTHYDIKQSQEDKATVPIFYEPRQVRLRLNHNKVDEAVDEVAQIYNLTDIERRKTKWAALAKAAGAEDRVKDLRAIYLHTSANARRLSKARL